MSKDYVEKERFYHIVREGYSWDVGDAHFMADGDNYFFSKYYHQGLNFRGLDGEVYSTQELLSAMAKFASSGERETWLDYDDLAHALKHTHAVFNQYLMMVREFVFEEVRRKHFPHKPSRQRGMWLIPLNNDALTYWWDVMGEAGRVFVVDVTGKIHRASAMHLNIHTNSLNYTSQQAFRYWSGVGNFDAVTDEYLFEGFVNVVEEVEPPEL